MLAVMTICAVLASICVLLWTVLFIKYRNQFDGLLDDVDEKIFTFKDLYFIGLGFIDSFEKIKKKRITSEEKALEKIKFLAEVFGRDNAEMYYYVSTSAKISMVLTSVPLGMSLVCLMHSWLGLICGALIAFIIPYGIQMSINNAVLMKKDAIISEFPKMISKFTMLVNAGMLVRRAWDEVANSNFEEPLYQEMRFTSKDIQEGKSIEAALDSFASRCGTKEIRKFASLYIQAVNRSPNIDSMKAMADEAWEQKKQILKQKGEIASQKLMIPNMIMFIGILIVVVIPMVASMLSGFSF
ncbi:MAG: type II secretion system F family protein [Lachnospiraceae bacterium]|nr:type II secretion system F family protein [Lachnospiraceae bacterium]